MRNKKLAQNQPKKVNFCNVVKIFEIPYENRLNETLLNKYHFQLKIKKFEKIFNQCNLGKSVLGME